MLIRLKPKGTQSVVSLLNRGTRTFTTVGVKAGAKSSKLQEPNMVNPIFRLFGGRSCRKTDCWNGGHRNAGASQCRSVMERIGVETSPRRESGQTSSRSCVTRAQAEPSQEEIANERGFIHV